MLFLTASLICCLSLSACNSGRHSEELLNENEINILIYKKGEVTVLDSSRVQYSNLLVTGESLFRGADTTYRLIVSEEMIK